MSELKLRPPKKPGSRGEAQEQASRDSAKRTDILQGEMSCDKRVDNVDESSLRSHARRTIGMPHHKKKNPEEFLMRYRYLNRWVNECVSCHRKGYKPETPLPERDNSVVILAVFRRLFDELVLDGRGLCEQCVQAGRAASRL